MTRLLRVQNRYFTAGAVFEGRRCIHAAPILRWMVGMAPEDIKAGLIKRDCTWEWLTAIK